LRKQTMLVGAALLLAASLGWADTQNAPVQAAGGGASADEYVKKSDLGFQWSGDARARLDVAQATGTVLRPRFRTRVRLGVKGQFADTASWGFRLATASNAAVSRNLTLGGGDANGAAFQFGLDQAWLGVRPPPDVSIVVGKWGTPVQIGEMVFDGDLTPPGAYVSWDIFHGSDDDLLRNVNWTTAWSPIREIGGVTADPFAVLSELNSELGPTDVGVGLYWFTGLNAQGPTAAGAPRGAAAMGQAGNQVRANGFFADDQMAVVSGRISYPFEIRDFPLAVGGQVIYNAIESTQNLGYEARVDFPKLWGGKGFALYRDVGQDATFSPWADSDLGAGTGFHSGVEVTYSRPIAKHVSWALSYFHFDTFQPLTAAAANTSHIVFLDVEGKF